MGFFSAPLLCTHFSLAAPTFLITFNQSHECLMCDVGKVSNYHPRTHGTYPQTPPSGDVWAAVASTMVMSALWACTFPRTCTCIFCTLFRRKSIYSKWKKRTHFFDSCSAQVKFTSLVTQQRQRLCLPRKLGVGMAKSEHQIPDCLENRAAQIPPQRKWPQLHHVCTGVMPWTLCRPLTTKPQRGDGDWAFWMESGCASSTHCGHTFPWLSLDILKHCCPTRARFHLQQIRCMCRLRMHTLFVRHVTLQYFAQRTTLHLILFLSFCRK